MGTKQSSQELDLRLLVIFLNNPEVLEDILEAFLELGVAGATVVNSIGMGRILAYEIPIFAGLRDAFPGSSPSNKIILVVTEKEKLAEIFNTVEEICGSFDEPGKGLIITLPVLESMGFRPGF